MIVLLELTRWLRCTDVNKSRMLGYGSWPLNSPQQRARSGSAQRLTQRRPRLYGVIAAEIEFYLATVRVANFLFVGRVWLDVRRFCSGYSSWVVRRFLLSCQRLNLIYKVNLDTLSDRTYIVFLDFNSLIHKVNSKFHVTRSWLVEADYSSFLL